MYPLKLTSVLKDIIWGGTALSEKFNKGQIGQKIAEAWVLACRNDGQNIIENGLLSGKSLEELYPDIDSFPLLIKLIDANDRLSVQVHPNDSFAKSEGLPAGKTEMWYILDAKPDAELVCGLKKDIEFTNDDIRKAAENGTLESYLNTVKVKKGDVLFIPAGLVHAIGSGILIAEIQQNSNTTYRMYDYNRRDKDGKTRELHIDKALQVINNSLPCEITKPIEFENASGVIRKTLCKCEYFNAETMSINNGEYRFNENKMRFFLCLEGNGEFIFNNETYSFEKGDAYLCPEAIGEYTVRSSECELITATV